MKPSSIAAALLALLVLTPAAQAHKRWLLPSHTVVSEAQWITVDTSSSNDIFFVDKPFPLQGLSVTGPDGKPAATDNLLQGHRRSVFDVNLAAPGTYRITLMRPLTVAIYELNGERQHQRGQDPQSLRNALPKGASKMRLAEVTSHLETFATVGAPSDTALKPTNKGLELVPATHPNDLYAGETARFRFLMEGKPAAGIEVSVMPEGTRYRDQQQEWTVKGDDNGEISLTWPRAGRYYLEATYSDELAAHPDVDNRRIQYMGTFEVLPL
ncbi:DUF4198 domain-containing protein [Alloalcanivorax mobilis]|uniref:DUF4198 domain-containing protein n=1 Tax=Alloalcanivorax mobilis TaxID=2019569 RepID=UPI000C7622A0|nr:DUF4198 domain-containing protein [Alloalcanivorax mobilis]